MSTKLSVHISAFNSDIYQAEIAKLFPELETTISKGRDRHEGSFNCDILIGFGLGFSDEIFQRNKNLKFVQALGTGVDGIDNRADFDKSIPVASTRGMHGPQMSELTFMIMLAFNRDFPHLLENQKNHLWERKPPQVLYGKTVGLLGVGLIAEALAKRCKAFEMKVVGISGSNRDVEGIDEMRSRDDLLNAVSDLDYLILLAPLTPENKNMVNADVLAAMKSSAYLINIARGGVLDDDAIIEALKSGTIAGAGLDVFEQEPLPEDSPFWDTPNLIVTPHTAGMSEIYVQQAMPVIENNLRAMIEGKPENLINAVKIG
ncbi:MAG: D-2-hydroxyacid dehydrogenase [Rhodospirillaceae bacterium]|jgi:D-2-hydroxyacid dehydrogenase (NADP+)|nr:D-2-hydroxyacid dehydrogenase [Rhodospirillaceae bacterium]MBT4588399.1 D-2-hydroxyacid dehydrogenase [Rhodospirillaceae bacterium]MBT4940765.1 D-2-hydroxyacid dehydrogenase [Rhodospirillaceae bacterium]MBT7267453.1 D-2-hydroxyacid dehydrogenase [Rhodospirillaceae bacterium]